MVDRLAEDHANAKRLAAGLACLPGIVIDPSHVETNIVYAELEDGRGPETAEALKARGVLANGRFNWVRFVTRNGITAEDVDEALDVIGLVAREGAGAR